MVGLFIKEPLFRILTGMSGKNIPGNGYDREGLMKHEIPVPLHTMGIYRC
jgi:hypothetical protein